MVFLNPDYGKELFLCIISKNRCIRLDNKWKITMMRQKILCRETKDVTIKTPIGNVTDNVPKIKQYKRRKIL